MLRASSGIEIECGINGRHGKHKVEYRGYFLVVFEKTGPEDSQWVEINGERFWGSVEFTLQWLLRHGNLSELAKV